jgi:ribose-phosphate pyrophosphokinase
MKLTDFNAFQFPGGERHIELGGPPPFSTNEPLTAHLRTPSDIFDLMLADNIMRRWGELKPQVLYVPYLPYARQDRHTTDSSPYSLQVIAGILNGLDFKNVVIYEPHSKTAEDLINNCVPIGFDHQAKAFIEDVIKAKGPDCVLLAPDEGAIKRTRRVAKLTGLRMGIGIKDRNPQTGRLDYVDMHGYFSDCNVIVLDDICDGGATFNLLADYMAKHSGDRGMSYKSLSLFVAHGIFSKGFDPLKAYGMIGTTDSFYVDQPVEGYAGEPRVLVYHSIG